MKDSPKKSRAHEQKGTILQSDALAAYVSSHAKEPHPYLASIRAHGQEHKWGFMLTTPDQAAFLYHQAKLLRANKILEVGAFYGHSTLALAAALHPEGKIISIEHNPKFVKIAHEHMIKAEVDHLVDFRCGEAPILLDELRSTEPASSFDLVFIDADKRHFELYWGHALYFLRPGGIVIFDNVLARGDVISTEDDPDSHITAVKDLNDLALRDPRVFSYIASIGDGMLVATLH